MWQGMAPLTHTLLLCHTMPSLGQDPGPPPEKLLGLPVPWEVHSPSGLQREWYSICKQDWCIQCQRGLGNESTCPSQTSKLYSCGYPLQHPPCPNKPERNWTFSGPETHILFYWFLFNIVNWKPDIKQWHLQLFLQLSNCWHEVFCGKAEDMLLEAYIFPGKELSKQA